MSKPLRVLIIEDSEDYPVVLLDELKRGGYAPTFVRVDTAAALTAALNQQTWDIALCDYRMPQLSALEALALLKERGVDLPCIIVSGAIGEEIAVEAMQAGARDYLMKGNLARLVPAVERELHEVAAHRERKRAEEQLRDSQRRHQELVDSFDGVIWEADARDFRFTFVSKQCERLLGYSPERWLHELTWQKLIHPEDQDSVLRACAKAIAENRNHTLEFRVLAADGRIVWVRDIITVIVENDGPAKLRGVLLDITEKKRWETQFLRTQRMESIGRLASGIAHDLNNILAPILISVPMLRWGLTPEEAEKTLATIETSAQRGADIVKQLLTYGRGVEGERVVVKPKLLIQEMVKMAQGTFPKNITITANVPKHLWAILGDGTQLHQVLLNLLVNARDAMPHGGTLSVTAENVRLDEQYASMDPDAKAVPHVLIQVADTGRGIAPEIVDKIFDPFFTTKEAGKGSGLGLSTVLGIVKSHGGFVSVQSELGKWSRFSVYLPAAPDAEQPTPLAAPAALPRGLGELVLVVDDEASICNVTKKTLERNGYQVLTACDGVEAVALYIQHRSKVGLVLTDIKMPIMDGLTLIRTLKRIEPKVKVIASSGVASEIGLQHKMAELTELGVNIFLRKPYTAEKMLIALHGALHGNHGAHDERGAGNI